MITQIVFYVFILVLGLQVGHLLLIMILNSKKHGNKREIQDEGVSLVICFKNEAENLRKNMPHWTSQKTSFPFEILLVNDGSEDESKSIISRFQKENTRLVELKSEEKIGIGKKHALKIGVESAKYDQIVVTDADCVPASEDWLQQMGDGLVKNDVFLGASPILKGESFLEELCAWESWWVKANYFALSKLGMPYMGVGRNMAFRKSFFKENYRFDTHAHIISGDDDIILNNADPGSFKVDVCNAESAFTYSEGPKDWKIYFKQKERQLGAGVKYRKRNVLVLGGIQFVYVATLMLMPVLLILNKNVFIVLTLFLFKELIYFITFRLLVIRDSQKEIGKLSIIYSVLSLCFQIFLTLRIVTSSNNNGSKTWK